MIAEKIFLLLDSASFENAFGFVYDLGDTTSFAIPPEHFCTKHFLGNGFRIRIHTFALHFFHHIYTAVYHLLGIIQLNENYVEL